MFNTNDVINGTYQVIKQIGKGGTGIIYLAFHMHLQKYVVLKRLTVRTPDVTQLRTETDILKDLHHTYLPQVYDFIVNGGEVFTVMDYIPGNDMEAYPCGAGNLPEQTLLLWLRQMAEVLVYLEKNNPPVIHSDIKPANIIVRPEGDICLIDFNISINDNAAGKVIGYSVYYASPEQIALADAVSQGSPLGYELDSRSDIYSTGATFYHLMTGLLPNGRALSYRLQDMGDIGYSPALCAVIDRCMEWDRNDRYPTAEAFLHAIEHLKKQDPAYRRYVLLKAASILLSASLAASGIWCVFNGLRIRTKESYSRDYAEVIEDVRSEDTENLESDVMEILNNDSYKTILEKAPADEAQLYHILGELYFYREDYYNAQRFYSKAASVLQQAGIPADTYLLDYAIALAYGGKTEEAASVIEQARSEGADNDALEVAAAAIYLNNGNPDVCLSSVDRILDRSNDRDLCVRACRIGAEACAAIGQKQKEIQYLERALSYEDSLRIKRKCAALYMEISQEASAADRKKQYAEKALYFYQQLAAVQDPSRTDRINLAIVYYVLEKYPDSITILKECEAEQGGDYIVSAYLAFCYWKEGDYNSAASYCKEALARYDRLSPSDREAQGGGTIDMLRELDRILN